MQRYFVEPEQWGHEHIHILGEDAKHIRKVMRMTHGDQIICCDNNGKVALGEINDINTEQDGILVEIASMMDEDRELPVHVTVVQGMPKRDKLEWVVQKGTELGMFAIQPFEAGRSVVNWPKNKLQKKLERLNKIAKEAAEQSHRSIIPYVKQPVNLDKLCEQIQNFDVCLLAYEETGKQGEQRGLPRALKHVQKGAHIGVVTGPEGGFSNEEIQRLTEEGCITCGLGPRVLRSETAPIYLLSAISYHFELLNEVK